MYSRARPERMQISRAQIAVVSLWESSEHLYICRIGRCNSAAPSHLNRRSPLILTYLVRKRVIPNTRELGERKRRRKEIYVRDLPEKTVSSSKFVFRYKVGFDGRRLTAAFFGAALFIIHAERHRFISFSIWPRLIKSHEVFLVVLRSR